MPMGTELNSNWVSLMISRRLVDNLRYKSTDQQQNRRERGEKTKLPNCRREEEIMQIRPFQTTKM